MSAIEIAIALVLVATIVGIGLLFGAIHSPSARKEMGVRLQDDDFDWIDPRD
jgi:hypothetical protein